MDDETLYMTMLLDFYGDLLTDKQKEYYDLYHNEDLSLAEIAEKVGITRQGVYDIIARAEKSLTDIEEKTGLIKRWSETREMLHKAAEKGESVPECVRGYFQLKPEQHK
ncbi:MAG: YlxM family DNA-binding protein [Oscillospiraceae bacterium]|nr:YlxM family DNA-binding protein [Oscillospiraceae bacterium]MCL2278844.1 YlxM family DNA-binding protein [Oscillospiraceae bacterium]